VYQEGLDSYEAKSTLCGGEARHS